MKMTICIHCQSEEQKIQIATQIHEQLVGNENYINSKLGVNMEAEKTVYFWDDTSEIHRLVDLYL